MADLRERFAEYRDVEVPDLWDRIEELATSEQLQPTPSRRRRPLAVALAAFVLVLVAGSTLFLLRPGAESVPPVDDGPVASAADLLTGWQVAEGIPSWAGLTDVVAFQDGFVAVGGGTGTRPGIWWSPDGMNWEDVARTLPQKLGTSIDAVTVGGPGLVAVGHDSAGTGDGGAKGVIAVWVSSDGRNWTRVPHSAVFEGIGDTLVWDLASDGEIVIAVGAESSKEPDGDWSGAVWTSADGTTWTRHADEAGLFVGASITNITRFRSGFVVVGSEGDRCDSRSGVVWTSSDGQSWTKAAVLADTQLSAVTAWDEGLLAVGQRPGAYCGDPGETAPKQRGEDVADVWTSDDGATWTRLPARDLAAPVDEAGLGDAADVGAGVVVIGGTTRYIDADDPIGMETNPLAWFSEDGASWSDVSAVFDASEDPEFFGWLSGVVATKSRVFVIWDGGLWVWGASPPPTGP